MSDSIFNDIYNWAFKNEKLVTVTIELTTFCNWKCEHCYIESFDNYGFEYEYIIKLLKELRNLNVFEITFTGGEVFIRKDFLEILKYARKLGFRVNILSNASLVTEEIVRQLSEIYISSFSLTIFSLDENIHDSITGIKGSLKKTINAIDKLIKYDLPLEIKTPILKKNKNEYLKVYDYSKKKGLKHTCSALIFPKLNGDNTPIQKGLDSIELVEEIKNIDIVSDFKRKEFIQSEFACNTLKYSLYITAKGDVYPCGSFPLTLGNIYNNSIEEIWSSKYSKNIRNMKKKKFKECIKCDMSDLCNFCPANSYLESNIIYSCSKTARNIAEARVKNLKN